MKAYNRICRCETDMNRTERWSIVKTQKYLTGWHKKSKIEWLVTHRVQGEGEVVELNVGLILVLSHTMPLNA